MWNRNRHKIIATCILIPLIIFQFTYDVRAAVFAIALFSFLWFLD